jgi:hypothetical protein
LRQSDNFFAIAPAPIREHEIGQMRLYKRSFTNKKHKNTTQTKQGPVFHPVRKQSEYQGYRANPPPDQTGSITSMPILIGAAMIAAAILLSTLVTALGSRYVGMESPNEESAWLIDRLTGSVYKCQASERGKATCEIDGATGSIVGRGKR